MGHGYGCFLHATSRCHSVEDPCQEAVFLLAFLDADIALPPHDQVSAVFLLTMNHNCILPVWQPNEPGISRGHGKRWRTPASALARVALDEAAWATFPWAELLPAYRSVPDRSEGDICSTQPPLSSYRPSPRIGARKSPDRGCAIDGQPFVICVHPIADCSSVSPPPP